MPNEFEKHRTELDSPGMKHSTITPQNGVDIPDRPRVLRVLTGGVLIVRDEDGVIIPYTVSAGEIFPFSAVGIEATNGGSTTTATVVGWR